jgi:hypothetical protein
MARPSKEYVHPPNFDWVTERHQCSAMKMFELLCVDAERNVETINALLLDQPSRLAPVQHGRSGDTFFVARQGFLTQGVRFTLRKDRIVVESQNIETIDGHFEATLTLDNDGDCRLQIKKTDEPLDRWQFLRKALEPLFFS